MMPPARPTLGLDRLGEEGCEGGVSAEDEATWELNQGRGRFVPYGEAKCPESRNIKHL